MDRTSEQATLRNDGEAPINLRGWQIRDKAGRTWSLDGAGELPTGREVVVLRNGQEVVLNDDGDTVELLDPSGLVVQSFDYGL